MAKPLRCSTCGAVVEGFARQCGTCGAQDPVGRPMTWAKSCPRCGHQGYGDHYFSKAQHIALLVVLGLATSGLGALIYWLVRFQHRLCPRCGLNWRHASYRPLPFPDADLGPGAGETTPIRYREPPNATMFAPPEDRSAEGWVRIGGGALLGFAGASMVSSSLIVSAPVAFAMLGAGVVVGGAALIWSGIARLRGRRGSPGRLRRNILRLASQRGGRLTASEVAAYLDLSPDAAKRLLDGMEVENSRWVSSDVTDEGRVSQE